jgi:drug/metabolite transporter (DMT)-like permease
MIKIIIIVILLVYITSSYSLINISKVIKRDSIYKHSSGIYSDSSDIIDITKKPSITSITSTSSTSSITSQDNDNNNIINEERIKFFPFQINGSDNNNIIDNIKWNELKDSKWLARTLLLIVSAFYGTNFGCVKILGESLDPSVAAAIRFTIAALVFLPFLINVGKDNQKLVLGGLEVGIYCSLGYWAQATALQTTNASNAAFICSLAVIVVPILDMLFGSGGKKSNRAWYEPLLPATLAAAGVGCLELGGSDIPGVGDLWAFLQPLFFGIGFWRVETHMKNSTKPGEPQAFTGAMLSFVSVFSIIWASHDFLGPYIGDMKGLSNAVMTQVDGMKDFHVIAALLWTGVVTTALTSYTENAAMKKLSASESTVIYSTEPLWGAAFASVALGEQLGFNHLLGAILILSACLWSSVGGQAVSVPALLGSSQSAFTNIVEKIVENVSANWAELTAALVIGDEIVEK